MGLLDRLLRGLLRVDGDRERAWERAKIIHVDDLEPGSRFRRFQDLESITLADHRAGRDDWMRKRRRVRRFVKARDRLAEIETPDVVTYRTDVLDVPRSVLRREVRVPIGDPPLAGTWVETEDGSVITDHVVVRGGWRLERARVRYRGPSDVANADEIAELHERLSSMTPEEVALVEEVDTSRFGHPVLFISHRWAGADHPDPDGEQLEHLRQLRDCYLIYDYSSFPQPPMTDDERALLRQILEHMDELVRNVVVLGAPDYLTRGWCIYEYLVASLTHSTVCDEIGDRLFVRLRNWSATHAPFPQNPFRDSFESMQQNHINERLLQTVNAIGPMFESSEFTEPADRDLVRGLLIEHLRRRLPPRKQHQEYLGEWTNEQWTDDELAMAFTGELPIPNTQTMATTSFDTAVPADIDGAVAAGYRIAAPSLADAFNPLSGLIGRMSASADPDNDEL